MYLYNEILDENVFGHTKKVVLFREAIERVRSSKASGLLHILDIGCGSGYAVTRFLAKGQDKILGVDMFPPNIEYANSKFSDDNLTFSCIDARELLLDKKEFDVIVLADILEHLSSPQDILDTAMDLLAPNGRVVITVPNGKGPFEIESAISKAPWLGPALIRVTDLIVSFLDKYIVKKAWTSYANRTPKDLPYNIDNGHVQFFAKSEIIDIIKKSGLEIDTMRNLSFLSGPFTNYFFAPSKRFCKWNTDVADVLPHWLASAWYFECYKVKDRA
ncbi:hypothetical protein TH44_02480 [Thalassospira xiamenensis]|uniref:Methyltransferase domain-containing protein n=2 Tax=Thalassospira xiamenensis TaxID=220697 RepID=A0A367XHH1_9PROT|nr:hypothetical protein TH44_02480 [Thalassospira xiamenensis]